jgi:hypothetical protein
MREGNDASESYTQNLSVLIGQRNVSLLSDHDNADWNHEITVVVTKIVAVVLLITVVSAYGYLALSDIARAKRRRG